MVGGVRDALGHRLRPALDQRQQFGDQHRVVTAVVHPARAQHAVLHGADEGVFGAFQRRPAVGERHKVGRPPGGCGVGGDQELDADLALRIVQPEPAGLLQHRRRATAVPGPGGQPLGEQLDLGRLDGGAVDDRHAEGPPVAPVRSWQPFIHGEMNE